MVDQIVSHYQLLLLLLLLSLLLIMTLNVKGERILLYIDIAMAIT